ncbi:MAG TPA: hypothetical protein VJC01_00400 [Candidatus Paceibacterota bacterium]
MAKPKKIVLKSDGDKKFSAEVFDLVRTKLAPMVGGNVNLGVKLAAEHFAPRKPATVTVTELEAAIATITEKFEAESKSANSNTDRLPLGDEAQANWDSGKWKGKLTVHGLRQKFAAEIEDGVDLTTGMLDAYAAELAVEKAKIAELVSEHDDPDSKLAVCGSPVHRGDNAPFQHTVRYRLTRNDARDLVRMKHPQGDSFIEVGNFLVVLNDEGNDGAMVSYCPDCRDAAWQFGRENETKVTFYTFAGAQRKLDAVKKSAEGQVALGDQLKKAAAKVFGGAGTRRDRARPDWRRSRGGR